MRRHAVLLSLAVAAAFLAGHAIAGKKKPKPTPVEIVETLKKRHEKLMEDVAKIQQAGKDWLEIQDMRARGGFVLNRWEKKMESGGKMDFHIFMERYRNDTLETLRLLDRLLGKEAYKDPLRAVFGDSLDDRLDIDWEGVNLEAVVGTLAKQFDAKVGIDGIPEDGLTINFRGNMTLLAAILQLENMFGVRMRIEGDKLWFVVAGDE